jgi:hypothetical protein
MIEVGQRNLVDSPRYPIQVRQGMQERVEAFDNDFVLQILGD